MSSLIFAASEPHYMRLVCQDTAICFQAPGKLQGFDYYILYRLRIHVFII